MKGHHTHVWMVGIHLSSLKILFSFMIEPVLEISNNAVCVTSRGCRGSSESTHVKCLIVGKLMHWLNVFIFQDQKIHEAVHTIESLRKSLLELQVE